MPAAVEPCNGVVIGALRAATRPRHAQLSSNPALTRIFAPDYSIAECRAHLGRLFGLHEPLETAVALVAKPADVCHAIERVSALRTDLYTMGALTSEIGALERCHQLPPISNAGVSGYTYVMLGSMLGGRVISKHMRTLLGPSASLRFYGDENGRYEGLWASFYADLEEHCRPDLPVIFATAVSIFEAYGAWLTVPHLPRAVGHGAS